jgi:hypothetical protein
MEAMFGGPENGTSLMSTFWHINFEVAPTYFINLEIHCTQSHGVARVVIIKYVNNMARLESIA